MAVPNFSTITADSSGPNAGHTSHGSVQLKYFSCTEPWLVCPALGPELSAVIVEKLGTAIDSVRGAHKVVPVPYGTDASTLAEAGVPSVVFGPGDIAQAHTRDEWVELAEVESAAEILFRLAMRD